MDNKNRPHSRERADSQGSVDVHVGGSSGTGPVGSGGRPGSSEGQRPSSGNSSDRAGSGSRGVSPLALLGLAALFSKLPKKTRRIVLIVVAVIALFSVMRGMFMQTPSVTPDPTPTPSQNTPEPTPTPTPTPTPIPTPDPTPSSTGKAREKRFKALGNGQDTVTIMVYMCGTDLESKYGMATNDLVEMTKATIGDNVRVIVETGGCKKWQNKIVSSGSNQIYRVLSGGQLETLEANFGSKSMVKPSTLSEFIKYCATKYPANRNILIFWDHGGGSITGYGYDEKNGGNDSMDLAEIDQALRDGGVIFDWIGFDTCLMSTLETDMVCTKYADYIIASEETEPGTGWYYTNWLTSLSRNTSIDTVTLAKQICDDFTSASQQAERNAQVTLSCVDLAELEGIVPEVFTRFANSTTSLIESNNYRAVSNARATTRQFAEGNGLNQIDLPDFCDRLGSTESKLLAEALRSCIKYNRTTISRANGISIYFPYESVKSMNSAVNTYNSIGFDSEYTKCIKTFASMASSGQAAYSSSTYNYGQSGSSIDLGSLLGGAYSNPLGSLLGNYSSSGSQSSGYSISPSDIISLLSQMSGRSVPSQYSWFDTETVGRSAQYVSENYINPGDITVTRRSDGKYVVSLTDPQWDLIETVELNVFVDDGKGFVDLGLDNIFTIDGNDLIFDYDRTWTTVNGTLVSYYMTSDTVNDDGSWVTRGRIPAILTRKDDSGAEVTSVVNLEVVYSSDNKNGSIVGWRPFCEENDLMFAKGNMPIAEGDKLQFLCDYYAYDGTYSDTKKLGDPITVGSDGLKLGSSYVNGTTFSVTYRFTDIYGNRIWTPALEF
ncbi:MAG: peptidase C11 [Oscillospiraceae bacterium]|nr:peptidase C11 [Oscillospiraceae bacterium]